MSEKTGTLAVRVEKADPKKLEAWGVPGWDIWTKGPSTFDWFYDEPEACYFLEGDVTVKTPGGEVSFGKGDFVVFPKGLRCTWQIRKAVRKHYRFGNF